jgi:hypothetical protein
MRICASRRKFRPSGVEGSGMARIMVAAITSLWLALVMTGCSSTSMSALMRSRAMRPATRAPWDEGPALSLSLSLQCCLQPKQLLTLLVQLCFELA